MTPVLLVGPTAVGKSAVALELASRIRGEIVSADSMQVYRGMDIGTAKPTAAERARVPHHMLDICDVTERFDVKQFVELARRIIAEIQQRGARPLVVGGSGLYVRALRQGLFTGPGALPELRARLESLPTTELFAELQRVDPETARRIDPHNPRRLVRALEVFYATGRPISHWQQQWRSPPPPQPAFCLTRDPADLRARIERRIDQQMAAGWLAEVRTLLQAGLATNRTAMQAAGYRELAAHLRGELTLEEAVNRIKLRTWQLARRQLTWFRREPGLIWLQIEADEPPAETAERIRKEIETAA